MQWNSARASPPSADNVNFVGRQLLVHPLRHDSPFRFRPLRWTDGTPLADDNNRKPRRADSTAVQQQQQQPDVVMCQRDVVRVRRQARMT